MKNGSIPLFFLVLRFSRSKIEGVTPRRTRRSTKKRVAFSRCTGIIQVAER